MALGGGHLGDISGLAGSLEEEGALFTSTCV